MNTFFGTLRYKSPIIENKTKNKVYKKQIINIQSLETSKILSIQVSEYQFNQIEHLLFDQKVQVQYDFEHFIDKDDKNKIYNYFVLKSIQPL